MAKKQKQWFSHDADAWDDPKIVALVAQYDMVGYGRWWRLLEILRNQDGYRYDIAPKFAYAALAKHLSCSLTEVKEFINNCIHEFSLLQSDEQFIWSESLIERMQPMDKKRAVNSENGKKSAAARNGKKTNENQRSLENSSTVVDDNANETPKNSNKLYNIRVDNTKEDNSTQNKLELGGNEKLPTPTKEEIAAKREQALQDKQARFYNSLVPFAEQYEKETMRAFYEYWSEPNKSRTQIRWEMEKTWDAALRLKTWNKRNTQFDKSNYGNSPQQPTNTHLKKL
jgi:hypothetical protein